MKYDIGPKGDEESIYTVIYFIAVTLLFMILRFTVTLFNFISDPKLRRVARRYTDKVSILIPARNEAANLLPLLESIVAQDYVDYEVIILDDDSTDDTYNISNAFCDNHPRFKIVKGEQLPGGWTGKNFACHQLGALAQGEHFLFLDAKDRLYSGLINSAVHRMYQNKLGLLSLYADQQILSAGEYAVVPLMHYLLLGLLPLRLVFLIKNYSVAAASGQFMLFNAQHYRENQWHEQVRDRVVEDTEIMRTVKAAGLNGETLLANGMLTSRLFVNYTTAVNGFSKNVLSAFNYNVLWFLIYIILVIGGPMMVLTSLDIPLILFMGGIIFVGRIMNSLSAGQSPVYNLVLHPVQMFSLTAIAFLGIQKYLTHTVMWKGRRV